MSSIESALPRLNEFIKQQLPTLNAPGLALGLTHRDQVLHVGAYGLANRETGNSVTPETLFQIGSISKSFSSIVLLQLQEQGLLDIYDPVTKYLPWFEIQSKYEPITLRHLMSHTAGIILGSDETVSATTEAWNLRYTKATAAPGEFFHYSNSGYKVLGLVLESVLKQSIGEILRERLLEPLGMDCSTTVISADVRSRLAVGYSPFYDDRPFPRGGRLAPAPWFESDSADGSICSTAEDMCKYLRMLLHRGTGLISQPSFEQLIKPVIQMDDSRHTGAYCLGLMRQQLDGYTIIGHSGGMVGFTADMLADLDGGLGVIVLANGQAEVEKISHFTLQLVRAAWRGEPLPEIPAQVSGSVEHANHFIGKYSSEGRSFSVMVQTGRLLMDLGTATASLESYGEDRFLVPHPAFERFPLQFRRENEQVAEAIHGEDRYVREGVQGESSIGYPAGWEVYTGHYRSHNPWLSNFRIVLRPGSLVLVFPSGEEQPLHPLEPDLFRVGDEPRSPEFLRFDVVIDGKARQAILSGGVYSRIFTI